MKRLQRTQFGNPILRKKTRAVSLSNLKRSTFKKLIRQMFFTMRRASGVGLAAPQIGESVQLAVIEIKKNKIRPHVNMKSLMTIGEFRRRILKKGLRSK